MNSCGFSIIPAGALSLLCAVAYASGQPATTAAQPKDHVLFVGTDFGVLVKGKELPVVDGGNRTFIVKDGGNRRERPLRELTDIQLHRGLKLTNLSATISDLEARLSSDAANAEVAESTLTNMAMAMRADIARDESYRALADADKERMFAGSELDQTAGHGMSIYNTQVMQAEANQAYVAAESMRTQQFRFIHEMIESTGSAATNDGDEVEITPELTTGSTALSVSGQVPRPVLKPAGKPTLVARPIVDAGNGRSDRIDLSFKISTDHPIESAYAVITTEYTIAKSQEVFRRVLSQRIGRIDEKPHLVSVYETNYPEGFHLRTYTVGIYARGQEVATNLSPSQMRMTREEAYQYLMVDYLASHRGQSRPPAAVLMTPRAELGRIASSSEFGRPVYISVNREGEVVRASADEAGQLDVSPAVQQALQRFRFIPALDKGVPVDGRAQLVVADFVR